MNSNQFLGLVNLKLKNRSIPSKFEAVITILHRIDKWNKILFSAQKSEKAKLSNKKYKKTFRMIKLFS